MKFICVAVLTPRLQLFSTTSKYDWSPWPPCFQQCKVAPSTVILPESVKRSSKILTIPSSIAEAKVIILKVTPENDS